MPSFRRKTPDADAPPPGTMTDMAEPVTEEAVPWSPPRRSTVSWVVYDLGDTVFQQVMITNYFTLWVAAAGGSASHIAFANSITMALMLGIGPWVGAVSDHLPRRVPLLMVLVTGCCLLTFFVGGTLWTGLALFLGANLFFQSGVVIYDALLPAVSMPENRGRVGGFAIGLSNLGAMLGIGLGVLVLRSGGHYETIFKLTAVIFFLLALPCLLWVKEPPRAVAQVAPLTAARGAVRDILTTAHRARDYPDLIRFLAGRAFYTEAANTIGLFIVLYLTKILGFTLEQTSLFLIIAIGSAVVGGIAWGFVVDRFGPRDSLMRVLTLWSLMLALIAATGFHLLPVEALWLIAPVAGFALAGIWASDRPLMIGLAPPQYLGQFYGLYALAGRFAALIGPLLWALIVDVLRWGEPTALVALLGLVLIAMVILRPLSSAIGRAPEV
jgi:UMF1 family MFS transporter